MHVWRYADHDDRAAARGASMATGVWRDFGAIAVPLVVHQRSRVYEGEFDDVPREELLTGRLDILTITSRLPSSRGAVNGLRSALHAYLAADFAVTASLVTSEGAGSEIVLFLRSESLAARAEAWRAVDLGAFVAGLDDAGDHHIEITSDLFIPVAPVRPSNA